ncbi:hypothetical protein DSCA_36280 [Desulfosarcina alkanivorans]|uniref:histidine kinase n=1 Tax=Desulfosarcina alkanivorans TaxID=571177 RepID=A0A5K7YLL2_9BACT|nr:hybrid sensor histidine kinase/response regulator [Desulfosarcina alkanivorans]BBO69698.1 hypothetical protein DSCA_36280 [Desulfosarcina alkanivorans]
MTQILIIEDESSIRKALSLGLDSKKYQIDTAENGKDGIQKATNKKYDVILSDLCLPDINGLEVIKTIKACSPDIISIVITGNGNIESTKSAIRLEVNDYLEKPLSINKVHDSLQKALKQRDYKRNKQRRKIIEIVESYNKNSNKSMENKLTKRNSNEDVSMLVHQINNPLCCINGSAELGMLNLDDKDAIIKFFKDILTAAKKINHINRELLSLNKYEERPKEVVDIKTLLISSIKMFEDLMTIKKVSLKIDLNQYDEDEKFVLGNKFDIEQIFKNLILNSIESMEESVEKWIKIKLELDREGTKILIHIQDSGSGITADNIDKCFNKYFTTKSHGTGLGLSVVKRVVDNCYGSINVTSTIGKGTLFTIQLPVYNLI